MLKFTSMLSRPALAAALALTLAAPAAQAITINGVSLASIGNGAIIQTASPGFGSAGPVTLNYDVAGSPALRFWSVSYSGTSAAYCGTNIASSADCALDLTVASGNEVTLLDFSLGGWPNANRAVDWRVINLADNTVVDSAVAAAVSGAAPLLNTINASSDTGFRIFFGPDGFNGGITSVNFSFGQTMPPIPLPAAGWLMLAGLGGLAALRRRKRA